MKNYSFPQFNSAITDPEILIDTDTVEINVTNLTLNVSVTLKTANSKLYGIKLHDLPRLSATWDDVNLQTIVGIKLTEFEIV
jgi:hypothetical protein